RQTSRQSVYRFPAKPAVCNTGCTLLASSQTRRDGIHAAPLERSETRAEFKRFYHCQCTGSYSLRGRHIQTGIREGSQPQETTQQFGKITTPLDRFSDFYLL